MTRSKTEVKMDLVLDVNGIVPDVDDEAALIRAAHRNARMLEERVRDKAAMEVGKGLHAPSAPRNRGDYPGPMADYYHADVLPNGDIILDNPTRRAAYFEFGTAPHEIWASGLFGHGQGRPPRGARGQFSKGARALSFPFIDYPGGWFTGAMVDHPGQEANPIMMESVDDLMDDFGEVVLEELVRGYGFGSRAAAT